MKKYDKNIFLVRHGRPAYTDDIQRYSGRSDYPLCAEGILQAQRAAELLSLVPFSAAYASPMRRAQMTAAPIMLGRDIPLITVPDLREIDPGELDGVAFEEARTLYPELTARRDADIFGTVFPGGESFADVERRAVPAFEQIMDECTGFSLVVCHAGVIRVLLRYVLGYPAPALFGIDVNFCGISVISENKKKRRVRAINLTDMSTIAERNDL